MAAIEGRAILDFLFITMATVAYWVMIVTMQIN